MINWRPWPDGRMARFILHVCGWTLAFLLLFAGQIPGWFAFFDGQKVIFAYTDQPFKLQSKQVHPGEALGVYVGRCNYAGEPVRYIITRTLSTPPPSGDESGIWMSVRVLEPIPFEVAPGCSTTLSNAHVIPKDLAPGRYRLQLIAMATYHGKTYSDVANSEPFDVVR